MKTVTFLLYDGKLQHFDKLCQLFTTVFQSQLLFWNTAAYLSFHGGIIKDIKLWSPSTHFKYKYSHIP